MTASSGSASRREALDSTAAAACAAVLSFLSPGTVFAAAGGAVTVLGANGKTGTECVKQLLAKGIACTATSRSGSLKSEFEDPSALLTAAAVDVTNLSSVSAAVKGAKGVIFAASASKGGGNAEAVDYKGVVNAAKACLENNVPRLVIVSSGGVSKPNSPVYKFLNLFGEIMKFKALGEEEVRALYAQSDAPCYYTIVRPGGLTLAPPLGVEQLEINQGDAISGRIARADVAAICVEAIYSDATRDTTFECYGADTGKPLDSVGVSNILKQTAGPGTPAPSSAHRGSTWAQLFQGLEPDHAL
ncbi:NADH(P)-binding-domain-containing protein [Tribonema minus]|uniref:NADH(P)-binding-domain-containing protein n=2 Tax=Tribonema minus TaxID=303371 RepID=A0A836CLV1_9STRA|nr:NADH(P)-binding-domain-containing protein [Tribonema minus]